VNKINRRGITLPDGKVMKTIDENGYNLGILEYDKVKEKEVRSINTLGSGGFKVRSWNSDMEG